VASRLPRAVSLNRSRNESGPASTGGPALGSAIGPAIDTGQPSLIRGSITA
jgi:hypothetical protein